MTRPAPPALRHAPHVLVVALVAGTLTALVAPLDWRVGVALGGGGAVAAAAAVSRAVAGVALALMAAALGAAGWAWGTSRLASTAAPSLELPAGATGTIDVDGGPRRTDRGVQVPVRSDELRGGAGRPVPPGTLLLAVFEQDVPALEHGLRLRVSGRITAAAGPGSPAWWRANLARRGIAGRVVVRRAAPAGRRGGLASIRDRIRNYASRSAGRGLPGERREIVRGLALGGADRLSDETTKAFRDAGLSHLLAVSGQNIAVVSYAVFVVLAALGIARRPAVVIAVATIACYCLACDGGASVARAGVVGTLGIVAELRSRSRERWYLLLTGLAALVLHQPRAIGDPGLQLSFAAVAGIFVISPPVAAWLEGLAPRRLATLIAQSVGATIATAPVLAAQFGRLSIAGLAVNVVAVPLAAPIVILGLAGIAAGAAIPVAGTVCSWAAGLGASALLAIARAGSAVPGAAVAVPGWGALCLAVVAVAVPAGAWRLWRTSGPLVAIRVRRTHVALAAAGVAAVIGAALPAGSSPAAWPLGASVTALDIGQGDAILLRSGDGGALLVDTGPPGAPAPVMGALRRMGVRRLDGLALTHNQLDHDGAAATIIGGMPVGAVLSPVRLPQLDGVLRRRGLELRPVFAGDVLRVGSWRLRVLWPRRGAPAPDDPNDGCLVMLASAPGLDVLLTGDAESDVLSQLPLRHVDVLKVSHHGSADPGLPDLLRRLRPRVSLISVGTGNRYGHPTRPTLTELEQAGTEVLRTDRSGSVTASASASVGGVAVTAERAGR